MAHKFFYAWQSERPNSVCRSFIREVLESISATLNQEGIDERIEIDSDTQGVPGTPEILPTILRKIEDDDVFIADLTMCSETKQDGKARRSPNPNVMFEYGYALKAKTRDRIICVMNTFYGGNDPSELPFDLRHARAPFRYSLAPSAPSDEKQKVFAQLSKEMLAATKLIVENLPSAGSNLPQIDFEKPHFGENQELTPEGDFSGQTNPTYFNSCAGFVYLKGIPLKAINLSIAKIMEIERRTGALEISRGNTGGSFGTNKWGRVCYGLYLIDKKRMSSDYVQYFRNGAIEIVNGSYLTSVKQTDQSVIHVGYIVTQIVSPMLTVAKEWLEKTGVATFMIEAGTIGVEGWRITLNNWGTGPLLHLNKISVQKKVDKDSVLLLAEQFRLALLSEAGLS
jgi:hypothetical protein